MRTCQPKSRPLVKETDVAKRVRTSPPWLERNSFTIISLLREETLPEIHYTSPWEVIILQFILANLGPILILRKCECEYEQDEGKRIVTIKMRSGCPHKDCIDRALCQLQVSCQVATKVFHLKFGFPFNCISWSKYDILQDTGWAGGAWQGEEKTTLSCQLSAIAQVRNLWNLSSYKRVVLWDEVNGINCRCLGKTLKRPLRQNSEAPQRPRSLSL